ncbi:MAG: cytochrome c maturation protein CcmE [bacterium]
MGMKLKSKRNKFIVGGLIVFGAIGYLIYAGIRDTRVYYMTPSEILARGEKAYGEGLRLGGIVVDGSIDWDAKNLILKFEVADEKTTMPVVYRGVAPDAFKNGVEIVVEGTYTPEGVFKATALFPKCPSKYEPSS